MTELDGIRTANIYLTTLDDNATIHCENGTFEETNRRNLAGYALDCTLLQPSSIAKEKQRGKNIAGS